MLALLIQWCVSDLYVRFNGECTLYIWNYLHHDVYQITISDLMMNVHICDTDNTNCTMLYIRTLCQIQCWMYTYVLLITLFTHVVCQITMSDLKINVHICATDKTPYTMVYVRSLCQIYWWKYLHVLLIALITPCCMSDQYIRVNDECIHMFNW